MEMMNVLNILRKREILEEDLQRYVLYIKKGRFQDPNIALDFKVKPPNIKTIF